MKAKRLGNCFSLLVMVSLLLSLLSPVAATAAVPAKEAAQTPSVSVEALVREEIALDGQTDFFIWMTEKADLSPAKDLKTKAEKGAFVFETLKSTAERTQRDLRAYLDSLGIEYQAFYIANKILVRGGTQALLTAITERADVAKVTANHQFQLQEPFIDPNAPNEPAAVESNISFINADDVWLMGIEGANIVLAGNDTGLQWDHPALINQYRGWDGATANHNYNWWDATGTYPMVPGDGHGHGTHTGGTMVGDDGGDNQIGVAPGAQIIHCKNMTDGGSGDDGTFSECFEWDLAPWDLTGSNADPALAPDAVNNSWGYWGGNNPVFEDEIDALQAAGIVVEVSAGNEGPGCTTLRSPSDYENVITTGSIQHASGVMPGTVTGFSSRGPSLLYPAGFFPDIMAPGENIRSSVPGSGYQGGWSGTSMSGPHTTALVALIWSAAPAFRGQVATTYQIIKDTAVPLTGQGGSNCGGDYTDGPNNDWGVGTIDALAAVQLAIAMGESGFISGHVYDDNTSAPISGATVTAVHEEGYTWSAQTGVDGYYEMEVATGTYEVTASHPQYGSETETGVVVVEDGTTIQDFNLIPKGILEGYVYDDDSLFPLAGATVTAGTESAITDGTGFYQLWLAEGNYDATATLEDYAPDTYNVDIVSGDTTEQNFYLLAAIAFVPTPVEITLDYGDTGEVDGLIINNMPTDYAFEWGEKQTGYVAPAAAVTIDIPAGPVDVTGTAVEAGYVQRPATTRTVQSSGINAGPTVLLVNADADNDGFSPIRDMLVATGDFDAVDMFDARYATPTLAELQAYNIVVVWANYSFADPYGIGDILADFVDAGGKVIDLNFGIDPNWGYLGRFRTEGYTAMLGTGTIYSQSCLGTFDDGHPIMDGVTTVCDLYRQGGTSLTADSTAVAYWADGQIFVAAKDDDSVVTLNGYVGNAYQWTGQFDWVLHNAILYLEGGGGVPWLGVDPASGTVPAEDSLDVTVMFSATYAAGIFQPGDYLGELKLKGDPRKTIPVVMTVNAPASWGEIEGTVTGLGYCDEDPAPLVEADVIITSASDLSYLVNTDASGHYSYWLDSLDGPYTVEVFYPEHEDGLETGVVIPAGGTTVLDFDLRWLVPCIEVDPATGWEVTLNLGETWDEDLTVYNDGAADTPVTLSDRQTDYEPTVVSIPAYTGEKIVDTRPVSTGRDPNAPQISQGEAAAWINEILAGEPAYAIDAYPGYNLVYIPDTTAPGTWDIVGSIDTMQFFGGDFLNGDFSQMYVVDYGTNSLYTVDTATGDYTMVGPAAPGGGESWTGLSGAPDGTLYGSATTCSSSTIYTVDPATGATTPIGPVTAAPCLIDIAINAAGEMYGVDIINDNLVWIDPATGDSGVVGYTGVAANYAQGMDFEEETGILYWAAYTASGELRILDTATGNSTLVGAFPGGAEVDCLAFATGGSGDAPWLYETPDSGYADAGDSFASTVTFDAGAVDQPGTYHGEVKVKTQDPEFGSIAVPATLEITAPASWGILEGTVTGLGYCDADPAPIAGAIVTITGDSGDMYTVETDENGHYLRWLDSIDNDYWITVSAEHHTDGLVEDITVPVGGASVVVDVSLRWLEPCLAVEPLSMDVVQEMGVVTTLPMTITNDGAAETPFEITDKQTEYNPSLLTIPAYQGAPIVDTRVPSIERAPEAPQATPAQVSRWISEMLAGEPAYAIDVYPGENLVYIPDNTAPGTWDIIGSVSGHSYFGGDFLNGDFSTLYAVDYDANSLYAVDTATGASTLIGPAAPGGGESWTGLAGAPDGTLYGSATTCSSSTIYTVDPETGATTPIGSVSAAPCLIDIAINADGEMFGVDIINDNLVWIDPATGDSGVVGALGVAANYAQGMDFEEETGILYWAAYTASGELRIIDTTTGASTLVGAFPGGVEVDCLAFATGGGGGGDALWLTEDPATGVIDPDSQVVVEVTFDSNQVFLPGEYKADITIQTEDPVFPKVIVPVTMTVSAPADWGLIEGTVTSTGYCDDESNPLEDATVFIVSSTGMSWTLTTDEFGHYGLWLGPDESPLTITVSADEHEGVTVEGVEVPEGGAVIQDFALRWLAPCVVITPDAIWEDVALGYEETVMLEIANSGAVTTEFSIREKDLGFIPAPLAPQPGTGTWLYKATEPVQMMSNRGLANAYPAAYRWEPATPSALNILVYEDDFVHTYPNTLVDQALQALGYAYTAHYDGDWAGFTADLNGGGWDMVLVANDNYNNGDDSPWTAVNDFVNDGGMAVVHTWWAGNFPANPLWATMGVVSLANNYDPPAPVYWWDPGHDMFNNPESVPELTDLDAGLYGTYGYYVTWDGAYEAIGGYTMGGPTPGQGALILGNDNRTLFKGFLDGQNSADLDTDGMMDGAELWINIVAGLENGFSSDVPWLWEEPITGTIPADTSIWVEVTLSAMAPISQTGDYLAQLKVATDDPVFGNFTVPVTMTVVEPTWGVMLEPEAGEISGMSGETVTFEFTVVNTGTVADTYDVEITDVGTGWVVTTPATITVGGGETAVLAVEVTVPYGFVAPEEITVTITSQHDDALTDTSTLTITQQLANLFMPIVNKDLGD